MVSTTGEPPSASWRAAEAGGESANADNSMRKSPSKRRPTVMKRARQAGDDSSVPVLPNQKKGVTG